MTDNPWEEHVRWFDRCPYLLVEKCFVCTKLLENMYKHRPVKTPETPIAENKNEGNECVLCLLFEKILLLPYRLFCTCSACGLIYNNAELV